MRGDHIGVSLLHQVEPGLDTGDIVFYQEYDFPLSCRNPLDYMNYAYEHYLESMKEFLSLIEQNHEFQTITQMENSSTYWPRLCTEINGFIDWSWDDRDIERFILAFDSPYAGASTFISGRIVRIKNVRIDDTEGPFHSFQKGMVFRKDDLGCHVACKNASLIVESVLDEKGNEITSEIHVGDRFFTPVKYLEQAMEYRPVYTPLGLKKQDS